MILMDRLSPDIFSTLRMKGCVLHRACAVENSGLITCLEFPSHSETLPKFLSRLNEIRSDEGITL